MELCGFDGQYRVSQKLDHFNAVLKRTSTIVIRKCDVESYVTVHLEGYAFLQMAVRISGMSYSRNTPKPSSHYMYHQFNIQQFSVLPTQCIYVFCVVLRTNSDYFRIQLWLVCITETESVYCAVRTEFLYIIRVMCFVWIWEQTAIISLYSINFLVFITEIQHFKAQWLLYVPPV